MKTIDWCLASFLQALAVALGEHAVVEHNMSTPSRKSEVEEHASSRPRVLHVIDSLSVTGGAERQLVANLGAFDHDVIEHHVATLRTSADNRLGDLPDAVRVWSLGAQGENPSRLTASLRLLRLVRDQHIDLIHASLAEATMAARIVGMLTRTPVVESLVNISHEAIRTVDNPNVTMWKLRLHTLIDWLTTRKVTRFHAVSQAVADSWAKVVKIDRDRIVVIPRSIDLPAMNPGSDDATTRHSVRDELSITEDAFLVITVGREEPQKGHRYLIEAAAAVRKSIPTARYLIVGRGGNASPALDTLISSLAVDDIVIRAGSRRDIPRLLTSADVFAFPSLFEGNGGNAMIEAMAAGLPVITTGAPPMTDLVPDDRVGALIPLRDSEALADALIRLHSNPQLRADLGRSARERAQTFSTPDDAADRYETLYREMLGVDSAQRL